MDVVIAGGHGKVARRLTRLLAQRGDRVRALIRNPDHAADVEADGAEAVVVDLEREADLTSHVRGADAVVFAAGAGPGSGAERKRTVDLGGSVLVAAGAALALSEGLRKKVLDALFGAEEEFEYTSTTSPSNSSGASAGAGQSAPAATS